MAITFFQQPAADTIQASDNPIIFVFNGSNFGQPNYSYIIETVINGITVSTDQVFPERGSKAHFDIRKTTLAEFTATPRTVTTDLYTFVNFSKAKIKIAERYGSTPATGAFTSSNEVKVMKACCDDETFKEGWIAANYVPSSKWLTDVPNNTYITSRDCPVWASILSNPATNISIGIAFYGADGALQHTHTDALLGNHDRIDFSVNETSLAAILAEVGAPDWDDVYKIQLQVNFAAPLFIVFAPTDCELNQQVSWLNKLGAYDQMLFSHNREIKYSIKALEYKKQFGNWIPDGGNTFVFNNLDSGDTQYLKVIEPSGSLYTGWISEVYQNWLRSVAESVDVMLHVADKTERIIVTMTETEMLREKFEEILNFQLSYKKTNFKSITQ